MDGMALGKTNNILPFLLTFTNYLFLEYRATLQNHASGISSTKTNGTTDALMRIQRANIHYLRPLPIRPRRPAEREHSDDDDCQTSYSTW